MTRENKAGLVVCGSFLCLLGAVAVVKLRQPAAPSGPPPTSPTLAVPGGTTTPDKTDPPTPPAGPPPAAPPAAPKEPPPAAPATPDSPPLPMRAGDPPPPPPPPPAPAPTETHIKGVVTKAEGDKITVKPAVGEPVEVAIPDTARVTVDGKAGQGAEIKADAVVTLTLLDDKIDKIDCENPTAPAGGQGPAPPAGPPTLPDPPPAPPAPATPPNGGPVPPVPPPPSGPTQAHDNGGHGDHSADDKKKNKPDGDKTLNVVAVPPAAPGPSDPPPPPPTPADPPAPAKVPDAPPPPMKIDPPDPSIVPHPKAPDGKIEPETAPKSAGPRPDNVIKIPADPTAPKPPAPPAAGGNVIASTPGGNVVRPPGAPPAVDSWDETTYVCKPGDDFASICKSQYKFAGAEEYAAALQLYNRNHPRAGEAMRRDGTFAPGDRIYVPPSAVLQKRHGDAITKAKPKPVAAGGDAGVVQAGLQAPARPLPNQTYKVQGPGESLLSVAEKMLHDPNRWTELAQLNPGVKPESPVPPGTVLQLPAGAPAPKP